MKRLSCLLSLFLALALTLPVFAFADDDDELTMEDLIIEDVTYDNTPWSFPVDLVDLDPTFIRLANKHYLLDKGFIPYPLVTVKTLKLDKDGNNTNGGVLKAGSGDMKLQETCAAALSKLCDAARADGYNLYLKSAYRSYQTQNTMYSNRLKKNNGKDDGWVAKPGSSDHQTGLGCDVVPKSWRDKPMNGKMGAEPECQWMAAHCHEYGFILRYPQDKENVTEINYEPWHLRYVGIPVATYIMQNGLCLEEFNDQLQQSITDFLNAGGSRELVEKLIQTPNAA